MGRKQVKSSLLVGVVKHQITAGFMVEGKAWQLEQQEPCMTRTSLSENPIEAGTHVISSVSLGFTSQVFYRSSCRKLDRFSSSTVSFW